MKVLFLSYDGLTDPLGQSQILPYIKGLSESGFDYSIISFEKPERFKLRKKSIKDDLKKYAIAWTALPYTKKPPVLSTVFDILSLKKKIKLQLDSDPMDAIHCRSYISMFAAYPIARKRNIKLVFDMRGFWIDERVEGGIWNIKNPLFKRLYSFLKRKERTWMNNSDLIISLTEKGKEVILSNFTRSEKLPIEVIPCCADEDHFKQDIIDQSIRQESLRALGIEEEDKILGYAGSVGTWYMAKEMMAQFKRLKENEIVNKFLWITPENKDYIYELALAENIHSDNIIVVSSNRKDMPMYLSMVDIGIFYIKPSFSKSASSPTKLGEMLLMGIPVICNSNVGDLDTFISEHNVGISHDVYRPESLNIQDAIELNRRKNEEIRSIAEKYLGLKSGILKYQKAFSLLE